MDVKELIASLTEFDEMEVPNGMNIAEDAAEDKMNLKLDHIINKLTTLIAKAKTNKLKSIETQTSLLRAIEIEPVIRPYNTAKPIIGVAVDRYGNLKFHNGYDWYLYKDIFKDKLGTDLELLQKILENATLVIGDDKGTNVLTQEQKRQEKAGNIAYSALQDVKSDMRRLSKGREEYRNIVENGKCCYEFQVRHWGDWYYYSGDYGLSLDSEEKLKHLMKQYNEKYKEYNLNFNYHIDEKYWMTVEVEW